jgi:hypothetical protein
MEAMCDTVDALLHDEPPLPEEKLEIVPFRLSNGTITRPLGCTNGWPPRPLSLPSVRIGTLHVRPPSVEVLISSRSPSPKLSSSV